MQFTKYLLLTILGLSFTACSSNGTPGGSDNGKPGFELSSYPKTIMTSGPSVYFKDGKILGALPKISIKESGIDGISYFFMNSFLTEDATFQIAKAITRNFYVGFLMDIEGVNRFQFDKEAKAIFNGADFNLTVPGLTAEHNTNKSHSRMGRNR